MNDRVTAPDEAAVEKPKPYDYVIALGKNYDSGQTPKLWSFATSEGEKQGFMSPASELVARAAAELLLSGRTEKVLFSTGYTAGKKFLSEAETMRLFVRDQYPTIPWETMEVETTSKNTEENGEQTLKLINPKKGSRIALLSTGYHFPRAEEAFHRSGWGQITPLTCEGVLAGVPVDHSRKNDYVKMLDLHYKSKYYRIENMKEPHIIKIMRRRIGRALINGVTLIVRR